MAKKDTHSGTGSNGRKRISRLKRLTLDVPEDLHRAIKFNALEKDMSMVEMLRTLLVDSYGFRTRKR